MFKTIMVPVDVSHADSLGRALDVACDLGGRYGADVYLVEVSSAVPGAAAKGSTTADGWGRVVDLKRSLAKRNRAGLVWSAVTSSRHRKTKAAMTSVRRTKAATWVLEMPHAPGRGTKTGRPGRYR